MRSPSTASTRAARSSLSIVTYGRSFLRWSASCSFVRSIDFLLKNPAAEVVNELVQPRPVKLIARFDSKRLLPRGIGSHVREKHCRISTKVLDHSAVRQDDVLSTNGLNSMLLVEQPPFLWNPFLIYFADL